MKLYFIILVWGIFSAYLGATINGTHLIDSQIQVPKNKTTLKTAIASLLDMMGGRFLRTYFNDFVLPGTRWCGKGNQASSPNDLGEYSRSDV